MIIWEGKPVSRFSCAHQMRLSAVFLGGGGAVIGLNTWRFFQSRSYAGGCLYTNECRSHNQVKCLFFLNKEAALHLSTFLPFPENESTRISGSARRKAIAESTAWPAVAPPADLFFGPSWGGFSSHSKSPSRPLAAPSGLTHAGARARQAGKSGLRRR